MKHINAIYLLSILLSMIGCDSSINNKDSVAYKHLSISINLPETPSLLEYNNEIISLILNYQKDKDTINSTILENNNDVFQTSLKLLIGSSYAIWVSALDESSNIVTESDVIYINPLYEDQDIETTFNLIIDYSD